MKDKNEKTLSNTFFIIPIALTILVGTKNHCILETSTKIQFHHITLNLTSTKPLTNWKFFISMKLNLNKNV